MEPNEPPIPPIDEADCLKWWVKIVGMLQQNWALPILHNGETKVLFVTDASHVFDQIQFANEAEAHSALRRNDFQQFDDDEDLQAFLAPPELPLEVGEHPNGPIYSSGRHWESG